MVQFLSISFFFLFLQFLLGFSKVPVFCVTLYMYIFTFRKTLPLPSTSRIEGSTFHRIFVSAYQTRRHHSPEDSNFPGYVQHNYVRSFALHIIQKR